MKLTRAQLRPGAKVLLRANQKEGWPEEPAEILGVAKNGTLTVSVPPRGDDDDGLREVTAGQIKKALDYREWRSLVDLIADSQDEIVE